MGSGIICKVESLPSLSLLREVAVETITAEQEYRTKQETGNAHLTRHCEPCKGVLEVDAKYAC